MKKVVFIEPRGADNVFSKYMTIPLLGPVNLATIAKNAGYDVSILNENILGRRLRPEELDCDVLCLSCITATIKRGKEIAAQYKQINPNGRVIIGGIHASMIPDDCKDFFDQVVAGEAEDIILDLLSGKIKSKIVHAKLQRKMDDLPLPNFRLIKNWEKIQTWPVMTSRGCPYDCNFCSVTEMFGRCYRTQSPERVMKEILRYKRGDIFFSDDHFAANISRTNKILDLMIESGFDRPWGAQVRTEVTKNPEFVEKMKEAGCGTVFVGFESINPKSLIDLNKKQTVDDIKRSIKVFHENGINVHGMFMLGSDSDTKDVFRATSDFCHHNNIDTVQYAILTPLPGTRTYFELEKQGRLLHKNWEFYDGLHAVFKPKHMTADELQRGMVDCFSDFYSYANALNDGLNLIANTITASVKKFYTKAHFPSIQPPLLKLVGKGILRNWLVNNRQYLAYLAKYD
jgi:radical SAM superfamily enzyme YgiQ (UPF0313 family)